MSSVLCITGMHRSGTSLTASWLQLCGLIIDDGQVYGPGVGNPKGHFEDADFAKLHAAAALRQHPASDGWRVFGSGFLEFGAEDRMRAVSLVRTRDAKYNCWGWKDPRTVLFLPQWKDLVPSLKTLLVWRPCSEVVSSLVRRWKTRGSNRNYRISILQSMRLWKHYNECVWKYKALYPDDSLLVCLHDLLRDDRCVLELINQRLGTCFTFKPLAGLFDSDLLGRRPDVRVRATATICHAGELEARLRASSDV
jgi:hypothetical protein